MPTSDPILSRIARALGGADAVDALLALAPRDLQSLLLHVLARRAGDKTPLEVLARYEAAPLFALGFVDPRVAVSFEQAAFDAAAAFEAVELSPVCPLGTVNVLSGIHQNNVLSATRDAELLADPTPVLALECARRRRRPAERAAPVRLCTSRRLVRMQPTPAGLLPHFRLFGMVTAATKAPGVEAEMLREHLEVWLRLFAALGDRGYRFDDVTVSVSHTGAVAAWLAASGASVEEIRRSVRTEVWSDPDALLAARGLRPVRGRGAEIAAALDALPARIAGELRDIDARVLEPLAAAFPWAELRLDLGRLEGLGYYAGPCVRVAARDGAGALLPLIDGGYTTWTQTLLGDRRERLLITGIGSDLACARFRA